MGIFKTLVSGASALFMSVLVLRHSMALDELDGAEIVDLTSSLDPLEIETCDDLWEMYDGAGPIAVHVKGDMMCTQHKVRSLLFCALFLTGAV